MDRKKEDRKMELLKDPKEQNSTAISNMIDKALKNNHKVYLCTDWHLYIRNQKGKPQCHKRKDFNEVFKNVNKVMTDDDVFIYLGDLCDGEMDSHEEREEMKTLLNTIPGHKILVLGNNDLFPPSYYKTCGFQFVVQSFEWENILFTHIPCKNDNTMNIHGHIHSNQYDPVYWVPYTNQIDVAWCGGREKPVELGTVIASQKKFSKKVKEDPSKFEEGYYTTPNTNLTFFEEVSLRLRDNNGWICKDDPYPSE